jgi:hypothetical protein
MQSIGPHFYVLDPAIQAVRIEEFASLILSHNPGLPLGFVANRLREALGSMGSKKATPQVRVIAGALEIKGRGFRIVISPKETHVEVPDTSPAFLYGTAGYWDGPLDGPFSIDE